MRFDASMSNAPQDAPAIEVRGLRKTYSGGTVALDGLDLTVPRGGVHDRLCHAFGQNGVVFSLPVKTRTLGPYFTAVSEAYCSHCHNV